MLNVSFEFDEAAYDASAQAWVDGPMRESFVDAVNRAAARVAKGMGGYLADNLHRATSFTLDAGGYLEADAGDPSPAALVYVRRRQASYLGYEVYGGTRTAGDPETLPGGVLVPARDFIMTADGNLDLDEVSAELAAGDARWLALGPPGDQVLLRGSGSQTVFLAALTPETHYDPELDLEGWLVREGTAAVAEEVGAASMTWA